MRTQIEEHFARSCYAAPDTIVVATALTDLEYLVPQALAQAEAAQAELCFIHAIAPGETLGETSFYNPLKADRDARLTLEVMARGIRARNVACSTVVRHGEPTEVIDEFLRERPAGRLILGTRATAENRNSSVGAVASQLLLQTPVPVCCVQHGASERGSTETPRSILYPFGEQGPRPEGMRLALDLASCFHSELVLLQILEREDGGSKSTIMPCPIGLWPTVRTIECEAATAATLLTAARKVGPELLVMEVPSSLGGCGASPGILTEVIVGAPCPVLTFPVLPRGREAWVTETLPLVTASLHKGEPSVQYMCDPDHSPLCGFVCSI